MLIDLTYHVVVALDLALCPVSSILNIQECLNLDLLSLNLPLLEGNCLEYSLHFSATCSVILRVAITHNSLEI